MNPGQYQMHQNVLKAACGSGAHEDEPDYKEMYEELLDIVCAAVHKNPSTIDSALVEYVEEHD